MARKKVDELLIRVRGGGLFPIDMLRYDRAFPASEIDSNKINDTIRGDTRGPVEIEVRVTANCSPTSRRWQSFNWTVTSVFDGYQWVNYQDGYHRVIR